MKNLLSLVITVCLFACSALADDQVSKQNEQTGDWELISRTEPIVQVYGEVEDGQWGLLPYSYIREAIEKNDPVHSCSLVPLSFYLYQNNDEKMYFAKIMNGDFVDVITSVELDVQGSGPCRHRIWSFDYHGPITIREFGCYGEIHPPKDAKGEISFDSEVDYKRGVFCY
jgi:hypothetical protein